MENNIKVVKILDAQRFTSSKTGNEYVKNIFVGTTQGQYPKTIAFSVMGEDKFQKMGIIVGGMYDVSFDVESREWNGKYFTECNAWLVKRIDNGVVGNQQQAQNVQDSHSANPTNNFPPQQSSSENDGLPF